MDFTLDSLLQALRDYHDIDSLMSNPLCGLRSVRNWLKNNRNDEEHSIKLKAFALQNILKQAIEFTKPPATTPDELDKTWRSYTILTREYIDGNTPKYIMDAELHIAPRTYQNERKQAIKRLRAILMQWEYDPQEKIERSTDESPPPFWAPPRPAYKFVGGVIAIAAVSGLPGIGKTAMTIEIAYDIDIRNHFKDGILWLGVGKNPDIAAVLRKLADQVKVDQSAWEKSLTNHQKAKIIHEAIGEKYILIILDDVWQAETANLLRFGGPNVGQILTTRFPFIAQEFAEKNTVILQELSKNASLILFNQFAPNIVESQPDLVSNLLSLVGGLPLAIILCAKYIRRLFSHQTKNIQYLIKELYSAQKRLELNMHQALSGQHPSIAGEISLYASISVSEKSLLSEVRLTLQAFGVFPPKPNSFSVEAALAIASIPNEKNMNLLVDAGLLERIGNNRYTLHQSISDYVRTVYSTQSYEIILVHYFIELIEKSKNKFEILEIELENIISALEYAIDNSLSIQLVEGINNLYDFLDARALYELANKYLQQASNVLDEIEIKNHSLHTLYNLGIIQSKLGNYKQSIDLLITSMNLFATGQSSDKHEKSQ